jgi:hypothetical protein
MPPPTRPPPEVALAVGDTFTQADLLKGRVLYDQAGVGAQHSTLTVVVRDENPAAPAYTGVVSLLAYAPADLLPAQAPAAELRRFDHHLLAADGLVVADGSRAGHQSHPGRALGRPQRDRTGRLPGRLRPGPRAMRWPTARAQRRCAAVTRPMCCSPTPATMC